MPASQEFDDFSSSNQDYNETFKTWTRGFDAQNKEWIREKLMPALVEKLPLQRGVTELRVLSVGSGSGAFDVLLMTAMLKEIDAKFKQTAVSWTVVEPNEAAVKEFQERIGPIEKDHKNIKFHWSTTMFEDFVKQHRDGQESSKKYHFVTFVHFLYYVNEKEAWKQAFENLLEDHGVIFAVKETEESTTQNAFRMYVKLMGQRARDYKPTKTILASLQNEVGIKYESFQAPIHTDITEVFTEGCPIGAALLKFLMHSNTDPRESPAAKPVLDFLKCKCWSERITNEKRLFISNDIDVFLVYNEQ